MARLFTAASSELLEVDSAVFSSMPATMACWFYSDDITVGQVLMSEENSAHTEYFALVAGGNVGGDPVRALKTAQAASTSTGYSANTWHHACAVFLSATSMSAFIDGGSKGMDNDSSTPATQNFTAIGAWADERVSNMSGRIAEAAIWGAALSDAEVALLAKGFSPLFFQPEDLLAYWPLIRDDDQDRIGDANMVAINTPTVAPHPPTIIYPAPPFISYPSGAPPAGNAPTGHLLGPLYGPLGGPIAV